MDTIPTYEDYIDGLNAAREQPESFSLAGVLDTYYEWLKTCENPGEIYHPSHGTDIVASSTRRILNATIRNWYVNDEIDQEQLLLVLQTRLPLLLPRNLLYQIILSSWTEIELKRQQDLIAAEDLEEE